MRHDNMKCTATSKYPMKGWLKTVMIFARQRFKTINPESNLPIILLANQASQVRCWRCDERVACDCHHWWSCLINEMMSITDDYDDDDGGNEFISPSLTLSVLASRLGRVSWSFIRYIFWDEWLSLVGSQYPGLSLVRSQSPGCWLVRSPYPSCWFGRSCRNLRCVSN